MATNKFVFPSLMLFALLISPMISGQYYKCRRDGCISTPACDGKCMRMGYPKGGECRIYSFGGACCCECNSKCDSIPSPPPLAY
ncbi:unnamed protein product [Cochlearia groenlandica]